MAVSFQCMTKSTTIKKKKKEKKRKPYQWLIRQWRDGLSPQSREWGWGAKY